MANSATVDRSEFRHVLLSGTIVGVVTAVLVILYLVVSRLLSPGITVSLLQTVLVLAGGVAAAFLPGFFAASRTTQGVASAAAIGLWGTIVFMAIDIVVLRPMNHVVGTYPWTWDAVGGGSTWWYLPIWWMLGTYLAWMGGLFTAARNAKEATGLGQIAAPAVIGAIVLAVAGKLAAGGVILPVLVGGGYTLALTFLALFSLVRKN